MRNSRASRQTVSGVASGRPIAATTLARIVAALARVPTLYLAVQLLEDEFADLEKKAATDAKSAAAMEDRRATTRQPSPI